MVERPKYRIVARTVRGDPGEFRRERAADVIEPFLTDAANYPGGSSPEVCWPESEADVAAILAEGRPVIVAAAQSSLTGGATPRGEVVLSTSKLAEISEIQRHEGGATMTVGPGVVLRDLVEALRAQELYYPPVPTYDGATVGGTVATNAAGAATFKYGTTRDWVEAITVVLSSGDVLDITRGEVVAHQDHFFEVERAGKYAGDVLRVVLPKIEMPRVPKTSAGYFSAPGMDLIDLFIGSEGTLGVVTGVTLRVLAPVPQWFVALVPVLDEDEAVSLATEFRKLATDGVDIAAIEYMDARSLEMLREDKVLQRLGLTLDEEAGGAILLQAELSADMTLERASDELAGLDDETIDTPLLKICRVLEARDLLEPALPALPGEDDKRAALFALREAVPEAVNKRITAARRDVDASISKSAADVIVPFERFADSLRDYREVAEHLGVDFAIWGHISDGNVHPNFIPATAEDMVKAQEGVRQIGRTAARMDGSPMSEHGVGRNEAKKQLLAALYGREGIEAMRDVKRALDPRGVLAPGVLF